MHSDAPYIHYKYLVQSFYKTRCYRAQIPLKRKDMDD